MRSLWSCVLPLLPVITRQNILGHIGVSGDIEQPHAAHCPRPMPVSGIPVFDRLRDGSRVIAPKVFKVRSGLMLYAYHQHRGKPHVPGDLNDRIHDAVIADAFMRQGVLLVGRLPADGKFPGAVLEAVNILALQRIPVGGREKLWNTGNLAAYLRAVLHAQAFIHPHVVRRLPALVLDDGITAQGRVVKPLRRGQVQIRPDPYNQGSLALVEVMEVRELHYSSLMYRMNEPDLVAPPDATTALTFPTTSGQSWVVNADPSVF